MRLVKPPKRNARERLASISHQFLSDPKRSDHKSARRHTFTIAVIDRTEVDAEFPLFGLCQQLTAHGWSSAIIDTSDCVSVVSFISRNNAPHCVTVHDGLEPSALEEVTRRDENTGHDVYFIRYPDASDGQLFKPDCILLVLPVTSIGSRETRKLIDSSVTANHGASMAVIVTGVPNQRFAELVTNRLAANVRGNAGIELFAYGFLSQHAIEDPCRVHSPELEDIIRHISDDIRKHTLRR